MICIGEDLLIIIYDILVGLFSCDRSLYPHYKNYLYERGFDRFQDLGFRIEKMTR